MLVIAIFVLGYVAIVLEHPVKLDKSASALLAGVLCWTAYIVHEGGSPGELDGHIAGLANILFFLLGAMAIVELIDAHDGFQIITARITTTSRRKLLVTLAAVSFVLSAVLDNLTTAIVMMSLVRRLADEREDRMYLGAIVVIAANAGGAWSPVGDVTSTMLWVGGQVSASQLVVHVLVPSLVSVAVPLAWLVLRRTGNVTRPAPRAEGPAFTTAAERNGTLVAGVASLVFVPIFHALTGLPPFMGILLGLGVMWAIGSLIHNRKADEERRALSVASALQRVDAPSILFFLGILLAIAALEANGSLPALARKLDATLGNTDLVTLTIGLVSAIVDNVPLVGAAQSMYSLDHFARDHSFWLFLAYCAGTGGNILIIGSAAGIAVMGIERIPFGWYLRKIALPALAGYFAGALVYLVI